MKKQNRGFTLVELLVAIAIIGILAGVGYPSFVSSVKKSQRSDAIDALLTLSGRMEEFYLNSSTYAGANITALLGSTTSSEGLYTLSFTGTQDQFQYTLLATPVAGDPLCGNLSLDSTGKKGVSVGTVTDCW